MVPKKTKTVKFGKWEAEIIHLAFPAERFHTAFVSILKNQLSSGSFVEDTKPLIAFIESWTAPGDFHDVDTWRQFDWMLEYGALRRAILDVVNAYLEKAGADLPN